MSLCGKDLDEIFAYPTVKIVKVKDRYLGLLKYSMLIGITIYILYVVFGQKKYLDLDAPVGAVRSSLQKPSSEIIYRENYTYCAESGGKGYRDPSPCLVWDELEVVYPSDSLNSMFITTRVTISEQQAQCQNLGPDEGCKTPWLNVGSPTTYFLAGLENYTVYIDHSFQSTRFFSETKMDIYAATADRLEGVLEDKDGKVLKRFEGGQLDILATSEILAAADYDLGTLSDSATAKANESSRTSGVILVFTIDYSNIAHPSKYPTYTYTVLRIPHAEYKVVETVFLNSTNRLYLNRHGIKIVFLQTGTIGRFSFQTMLVQFASGLGLLSMANLITDSLMLYFMPQRRKYTEYKYEETDDFSDIRDKEKQERENK